MEGNDSAEAIQALTSRRAVIDKRPSTPSRDALIKAINEVIAELEGRDGPMDRTA